MERLPTNREAKHARPEAALGIVMKWALLESERDPQRLVSLLPRRLGFSA